VEGRGKLRERCQQQQQKMKLVLSKIDVSNFDVRNVDYLIQTVKDNNFEWFEMPSKQNGTAVEESLLKCVSSIQRSKMNK